MGHIEEMDMVCASLAFIDGLGGPEMILIFVLVLVLFGGQKLPEFARGLGKSIREFKKAAAGVEEEFKRALDEDERKTNAAKLAAAPTEPAPVTDEYMDSTSDSGGPDAEVHSPVTDDHVSTETVPPSDDVPHDDASPSYDDTFGEHDTGHEPPPEEPKIMPPASIPAAATTTPPKPPSPPPPAGGLENPS
ncbi:MAG: Sec-independent protein translocase subunit TatA/TatB [Opitutaceae bacterium]